MLHRSNGATTIPDHAGKHIDSPWHRTTEAAYEDFPDMAPSHDLATAVTAELSAATVQIPEPVHAHPMCTQLALLTGFFAEEHDDEFVCLDALYPEATPDSISECTHHQCMFRVSAQALAAELWTARLALWEYPGGCPPPATYALIWPLMRDGAESLFVMQHSLSPAACEAVKNAVQVHLQYGIDEESGAFSQLPIFTKLKLGTDEHCILFDDSSNNCLNMRSVGMQLPRPAERVQFLRDARIVSSIDMASFFTQLRLAADVADFWVYDGAHYSKLRTWHMVQGNSESPAIAQAFLTHILGVTKSLRGKLLVYIDNVYLKDMAGDEAVHIMDVGIMLRCLAAANITVNMWKSLWCATSSMEVLGCMWSVDHSWADQDALRKPWAALQQALLNVCTLYQSDDPEDLVPVAYFSRTFGGQQGSKPSIWREACAAYEAIKYFYPYLDGCANFWLETDCAVIVSLHTHKTTNDGDVLAHFKLGLAELGVKKNMIFHCPGVDQQTADWLLQAKERRRPSKACSVAPEMGSLKEAEETIRSNGIVYMVGALMASTRRTVDSTDTAEEMAPSANDDDWADGSDGHGLPPWMGSDDEDGWVPDDDEDVNGSNPQLPSRAEQYHTVQVALRNLPWLSEYTNCQDEDTEIQLWIALCHQCEQLEDLLMPKFCVVEIKCLCGAVLYELVGGHGGHDAVGTWVLALTRQAARWYVKVVHHALAHPGNTRTLKFIT
ncbi:hypothetical protein LPJ61_001918 [Coemansia biformis]|uniref:Reverse transcriptase RNase H-like domain-containing protein n=1 Tax=Coemansia biformis TaxID=1286918 RepID=A0A9W7Y980_9FUNG|nr:hypothetical protein LPJ61_001918 [Coemansia biformis]